MNNGNLALPGKLYSFLKWFVMIVLPAFATAYFTLGDLWEFPRVDQVVGTIVVVETFLGVVLGVSTNSYNKSDKGTDGVLVVQDILDPESHQKVNETHGFEFNQPLEGLASKDRLSFGIKRIPSTTVQPGTDDYLA